MSVREYIYHAFLLHYCLLANNGCSCAHPILLSRALPVCDQGQLLAVACARRFRILQIEPFNSAQPKALSQRSSGRYISPPKIFYMRVSQCGPGLKQERRRKIRMAASI